LHASEFRLGFGETPDDTDRIPLAHILGPSGRAGVRRRIVQPISFRNECILAASAACGLLASR